LLSTGILHQFSDKFKILYRVAFTN